MMEYQNPKIPEGINITDEHPLKDFSLMLLGVGIFVFALIGILMLMAEYLVKYVPFETELALAEHFPNIVTETTNRAEASRIENYLQDLAEQLAEHQQLPEEMKITVHYIDAEEVNAFATLGGNIVIFSGLLNKMPHENALAMVMAHEIAHIKHRDPIVALGRGVVIGLAMMSLMGAGDSSMAQQLVGNVTLLTGLNFSRRQERQADHEALNTLQSYYGHVNGAEEIFKLFMQRESTHSMPEFLSTHPQSEERVEAVQEFSQLVVAKSSGLKQKRELKQLPSWLFKNGKSE